MRTRALLVTLLAAALAGCAAAQPEPPAEIVQRLPRGDGRAEALAPVAWMSGHWRGGEHGHETEELWTTPEGGLMLGVNRTFADGRAVAFEYLRVAVADGEIVYLAQPSGRPATAFTLADHGDGFAVFANPEHDYPQAVRYARDGDALTVTISRLDGSEARSWTWRRVE